MNSSVIHENIYSLLHKYYHLESCHSDMKYHMTLNIIFSVPTTVRQPSFKLAFVHFQYRKKACWWEWVMLWHLGFKHQEFSTWRVWNKNKKRSTWERGELVITIYFNRPHIKLRNPSHFACTRRNKKNKQLQYIVLNLAWVKNQHGNN